MAVGGSDVDGKFRLTFEYCEEDKNAGALSTSYTVANDETIFLTAQGKMGQS